MYMGLTGGQTMKDKKGAIIFSLILIALIVSLILIVFGLSSRIWWNPIDKLKNLRNDNVVLTAETDELKMEISLNQGTGELIYGGTYYNLSVNSEKVTSNIIIWAYDLEKKYVGEIYLSNIKNSNDEYVTVTVESDAFSFPEEIVLEVNFFKNFHQ